MRTKRTIGLLAALAILGALTGCTPEGTPNLVTNGDGDFTNEAAVERRSIDTVIVADATVVAGYSFTVSAPVTGRFTTDVGSGEQGFAIVSASGVVKVSMPVDARVDELLVLEGDTVQEGLPIVRATLPGFALVAAVAPGDILRILDQPLSARAQIERAAGPFDCELTDPYPSLEAAGTFSYACLVPAGQRVLEGMPGKLAVTLSSVPDVLALPVEAVAGSVDSGLVRLRIGDEVEQRKVELGASDGFWVEIKTGVSEGDLVLLPSPSMLDPVG